MPEQYYVCAMHVVTHKRHFSAYRASHRGDFGQQREPGSLPSFFKPIGLDFIVTPKGRVVLVELNHGFGRRGLMALYPEVSREYRRSYWQLRRDHGKSMEIIEGVREICSDKSKTYKLLWRFQPSSLVYRVWNSKVERWLDSLESDYILAKPFRGCCGEGILVLDRREFRRAAGTVALGHANLLQEYVESRMLPGEDGQQHIGCIRHIMMIVSDGQSLRFTHMPSYWRVSPTPFADHADKDALTANISRGASALAVDEADAVKVRAQADEICTIMVQQILGLEGIPVGQPSEVLRNQ